MSKTLTPEAFLRELTERQRKLVRWADRHGVSVVLHANIHRCMNDAGTVRALDQAAAQAGWPIVDGEITRWRKYDSRCVEATVFIGAPEEAHDPHGA